MNTYILVKKNSEGIIGAVIPPIVAFQLEEVKTINDAVLFYPVTEGVAPMNNAIEKIDRPFHLIPKQVLETLTPRYKSVAIEVFDQAEVDKLCAVKA